MLTFVYYVFLTYTVQDVTIACYLGLYITNVNVR